MKLKIRSLWQKIEHFLASPGHRKLVLLLVPCVVLVIALALVLPGIDDIGYRLRGPAPTPESLIVQTAPPVNQGAAVPVFPLASPVATVPPAPSAAQPAHDAVKTSLRASSADRDLYITVYDEAGRPVTGETFTLSVGYPDGQTYDFNTQTDGSCYLVQLSGGEYTVRMQEHAGYATAEAITCTVREQLVYERIENVDEYVEVKEVTDVPQDEVETEDQYAAPSETVAEELVTPQDAYAGEQIPVLDANGNQTYTYTYDVGENGYLLYRDSLEESNVLPVDEDEDGQLDYGIYFYIPQTPEEGTESELTAGGYYVSEVLFNEDNTPVEKYAIYAEPIMSQGETSLAGWQEINGSIYYYDTDGNPVKGLKKIDGRIYYFDQYGVRASSVGIDVSYYDGDINWQAVKAQGIDFAIIRVGGRTWQSGTIYYDNRTIEYFTEAKRAGLKVGAYFYSTAVSELEAVEEASVTLNVLNGVSLDYPVFYDTEYSGLYPEGRADNLDKVQRAAFIRAFCETILNSSNYSAGVYSGEYFMKNNLDTSSFSQYSVWLASYTNDNKLPAFGSRYDIWQFTDRGVIDGINGYVDMNVIF